MTGPIQPVFRAFISYFREDIHLVRPIVERLEQLGIPCWMDEARLEPGTNWTTQIRSVIQSAQAFIYFHSARYYEKPDSYVRAELAVAVEVLRERHQDALWYFTIALDGSRYPNVPIDSNRALGDYHFDQVSGPTCPLLDAVASRIRVLFEDPGFNSAAVTLIGASLHLPLDVYINNQSLGKISKGGIARFTVSPGRNAVHCSGTFRTAGPHGEWYSVGSNRFVQDLAPRSALVLQVRRAATTGFLFWKKWEQDCSYIIETI